MAPSLRITQAILAEVPSPAQGVSLAAAQVVRLGIHIKGRGQNSWITTRLPPRSA